MKNGVLLFCLSLMPPVFASQVCLEKSTGRLVEYQSAARPGTCLRNALSAGFDPSLIEEREITEEEWKVLREEQIEKPRKALQDQATAEAHQKALALEQKLGLTQKEFDDLREALRH